MKASETRIMTNVSSLNDVIDYIKSSAFFFKIDLEVDVVAPHPHAVD